MIPRTLKYNSKLWFSAIILLCHSFYNPTDSGAVQITQSNIDMILASNEIVFINFYADWCRFSNLLMPIFDEAADEVTKANYGLGKVVLGKVDCDQEAAIATRFHITKYPTLKYFINGLPAKKEYRGSHLCVYLGKIDSPDNLFCAIETQAENDLSALSTLTGSVASIYKKMLTLGQRSAEAFAEFIKKQLTDPIETYASLQELKDISQDKRHIIAYMDRRDQEEYQTLRRVAATLKDECIFHAGFGDASQQMHPPGQPIVVFRTDRQKSTEPDETYTGSMKDFTELHKWVQEKCIPLVREITFENAEELTEEGLPFLILFYHSSNLETIKKFKDVVKRELEDEKHNINFLTADGERFEHPLHHLGKSLSDLPVIAIDSFRHMYLFPDYNEMDKPGKLKGFLQDLYSGKLHREFHYGPDTPETKTDVKVTTPPESTFKKLAPSKNRYTLLKDEL